MSKYDKAAPTPTQKRSPQKKSGGGTLVGVFVGLVIGLAIAFGVVFYLNKATLPFQLKGDGAAKTEKSPDKPGTTNGTTTPAPLPGKPGDKVSDKQRFEFYGILEGKQPANPGSAPSSAPNTAPSSAAAAASPAAPPAAAAAESKPATNEVFFLQAGAFQKPADADNLKAKLALSGLEAGVQEVSIPDKGTMHRVRVGPFRSLDEMNRVRTQLSQAGVQASVVKQKD
jgi:cell division protein FtsN